MRSESEVQQVVQIEARKNNCRLERNNSGCFTDQTGRQVRFGLGNVSKKHSEHMKSSDLIGMTSVVVTPAMVGKTIAIFTAIETKKEGWIAKGIDKREQAQQNYIDWVKSHGGIAGFVSSVDKLVEILKR